MLENGFSRSGLDSFLVLPFGRCKEPNLLSGSGEGRKVSLNLAIGSNLTGSNSFSAALTISVAAFRVVIFFRLLIIASVSSSSTNLAADGGGEASKSYFFLAGGSGL
jgi:hypothetical protein